MHDFNLILAEYFTIGIEYVFIGLFALMLLTGVLNVLFGILLLTVSRAPKGLWNILLGIVIAYFGALFLAKHDCNTDFWPYHDLYGDPAECVAQGHGR